MRRIGIYFSGFICLLILIYGIKWLVYYTQSYQYHPMYPIGGPKTLLHYSIAVIPYAGRFMIGMLLAWIACQANHVHSGFHSLYA